MYINTKQRTQGDAYVNTATSVVSATVYTTKLSRLDFLANALSTSSGVGQCSRWHCSKRSASSRSPVMVERIDVSVRCNLEKTRSDSNVPGFDENDKTDCFSLSRFVDGSMLIN